MAEAISLLITDTCRGRTTRRERCSRSRSVTCCRCTDRSTPARTCSLEHPGRSSPSD